MTTIGLRKLVTGHGVTPGHRPTARLEGRGATFLMLDLGLTTLQLGLGDDPQGALEALRDDLGALIDTRRQPECRSTRGAECHSGRPSPPMTS